jgi:hypothetical protein
MLRIVLLLLLISAWACDNSSTKPPQNEAALFLRLSADDTGLAFENKLTVQQDFDVFRYRNFYNGGGVAIGDINNDGLPDIYLTSNMAENKLFLNKGNWKFEDITKSAGIGGTKVWSTGVSMADVNNDGWLDIYVCNSGDLNGNHRENELFINNKDLTFSDQAVQYGLADNGFSTHAVFFDYDKDDDLDCYVLNNSFRPVSSLGYRNLRNERDEAGGDKLFRNENGHFKNVSEEAGIFGSVIGFGLGVTVGDINRDTWPDIYVSNDFYERDYLYINNQDGTFSDRLPEFMGHLSMFSMGADLADINNDGFPDIFTTDMLPSDDYRLKTVSSFEAYDVYQVRLKNDYYHQFMRNMLQVNNKDGTFSEVGQLAGVDASDWSWGGLIADFNNDLNKDIFVCNGIYRDVINQDFVEYLGNDENMKAAMRGEKIDFNKFVDQMPSVKLSNYMFSNTGNGKFTNVAAEWGLAEPSFSNGAAYGDIDNDGDIDLLVNNVNQELFVYKNLASEQQQNNFIAAKFIGTAGNHFGIGATVMVYVQGQVLYYENMPMRGFQSSMDFKMTLGVGQNKIIDSIYITWPDKKIEKLKSINVNQTLIFDHKNAREQAIRNEEIGQSPFLSEVPHNEVRHVENFFNEFDRDRLLYHMQSTNGPAFAVADLNQDGMDDFYLGGSVNNPGSIYLQVADEKFEKHQADMFARAVEADDVDAAFFDFDNDKDLDLYVMSGGTENSSLGIPFLDRLYENTGLKNGKPTFVLTSGKLPAIYQSGSCVRPADVDRDGDLDLFIGNLVLPSYYGLPCEQTLLINDGQGNFKDLTNDMAPQFKKLGMVTDAQWFDYDGNGFSDLIIVGEWMPITIFSNDGKKLTKIENIAGLEKSEGWWNSITTSDLDGDGDTDFILGNLGQNSRIRPTLESPISLYVNDFDQNGSIEPIFAFQKNGVEYPLALRPEIIKQMSSLKKQFLYYKDYANKSVRDIFDSKLLDKATHLTFYEPNSLLLLNHQERGFERKILPLQAQYAPVYAAVMYDLNQDSKDDLLLGGNLFSVKPEIGRYDALHGLVLLGDKQGNFVPVNSLASGLKIQGEVRHIAFIQTRKRKLMAFVRNNDTMKFYKMN